ncbi:MAG: 7-carboxy-7-deazaguanine synthase QueE [Panacagrimonas sp.]
MAGNSGSFQSESQAARIRVTEVFLSLQGESSRVGLPTAFIRLTGCPLRCVYCDTSYAFSGGEVRTIGQVVSDVSAFGVPSVCVTGGEPLAQKSCIELLKLLCDEGFSVSLETSGALDVTLVDPRVSRIVDIKTPASGESSRNLWSNIAGLSRHDEIKFVICDRGDYEWAKQVLAEHQLADRCPVLFSPSHEQVSPSALAQWVIDDRLPVRFQMQLHKVLWGNKPGR